MRYHDHLDHAALTRYAAALNQRASQTSAPGRISPDDLRGVILDSGGRCAWCDANLLHDDFEIDHIWPLSRQGRNVPGNLAVTCPACNRRKAGRHPASFAYSVASRTGRATPLTRRILSEHDSTPVFQPSFWDVDTDADPLPPSSSDHDDDADEVPPYRWGV